MKIKALRNSLVIAVVIGAILLTAAPSPRGTIVHSATPEGTVENMAYSDLSDGRSTVTMRKLIADQKERSAKIPKVAVSAPSSAAVIEWNAEAARLTLLTASNLAPVQQGRAMAIVQVAVHDAVNGITGKYATYLPAAPAPAGASPIAAAIASSIAARP